MAKEPGERGGEKNVPHWKKRTWSVHIPPDVYPAAQEALELPQFAGIRNILLNRALRAYLRWLYKKGMIETDITRQRPPSDQS